VARTNALGHELEDILADFRKLTDKDLPTINPALQKKKLDPIPVLSEADWTKQHEEAASSKPSGGELREMD
jgi:hypothetical protein